MTPRSALAGVVGIYVVLALLVATLTPPWEPNDEADHVRNVETLVEGRFYRIPPEGTEAARRLAAGMEPHQAPLYYMTLAGWQQLVGLEARPPEPVGATVVDGIVAPREGQPLYRHDTSGEDADRRLVTLLRLPGILFGAVTILLTAVVARQITADPWTPTIAAAIVASVPKFTFLSGAVNNDNLIDLLGAAGTVLAVVMVARPEMTSGRRTLMAGALGAVLGAILLTKVTAAPLGLAFLIAAVWSAQSRREAAKLAGVLGAVALLLSSWWFIRNVDWYGDPFAQQATRDYLGGFVRPVDTPLERAFVAVPKGVWKSFWYISGWNQFYWPWWAYIPFWVLSAASLARLVATRAIARMSPPRRRATWVLVALSLSAMAIVWVVGLETPQTQARIAFGALPAIACLLALGVERLPGPPALRFALPLLGFLATLASIQSDVVAVY